MGRLDTHSCKRWRWYFLFYYSGNFPWFLIKALWTSGLGNLLLTGGRSHFHLFIPGGVLWVCPVLRSMGSPTPRGIPWQCISGCWTVFVWSLSSMSFCLSAWELSTSWPGDRKERYADSSFYLNAFSRKIVSFGYGSLEFAHKSRLSLQILAILFLIYTLH